MSDEVSYDIVDRNLVIRLNKELDHHNSEAIRQRADRLIEIKGIKNIIFDFENVSFMDSSGIGVIMGRYKKIVFNKGQIVVVNINERIDRILRMSGLYRLVTKDDSIDTAFSMLDKC